MRRWSLALVLFLAPACDGAAADALSTPPDAAPQAPGQVSAHDAGSVAPDAAPSGPHDAGVAADSAEAAGEAATSTPAPPPCAGAFVCDDFEQDTAGQPPGAPFAIATPSCAGAGVVAIDASQAHSGTRSAKVTGGGGYCDHVFFGATLPSSATTATLWARFFVRLDAALGPGHVTFLAMHDASTGKDLRMGGQDQVLMWNRESDDATLPAMSPAGTAMSQSPAPAAWTCVELAIDPVARTLQTWVDGALVPGLVDDGVPTPDVDAQWLQGTAWTPRLTDVRFGWESYAGQADTLWFDDVAVGAARIGCGS
jgi:hypothetical protein